MLSKACIVGIYQPKLEAIAGLGVDLSVLAPPSWKDERGEQRLERSYTRGYQLRDIPIRFNGNFHMHHYPTLGRELRQFRPDIVHIDEEPYNLATWQALYQARRQTRQILIFHLAEYSRASIRRHSVGGRPGSIARRILRWRAPMMLAKCCAPRVTPVRYRRFRNSAAMKSSSRPAASLPERPFTIGFFGRIVPEKGLEILLRAAASLSGDWQLRLVGGGPAVEDMRALAATLGIGRARGICRPVAVCRIAGAVPSH